MSEKFIDIVLSVSRITFPGIKNTVELEPGIGIFGDDLFWFERSVYPQVVQSVRFVVNLMKGFVFLVLRRIPEAVDFLYAVCRRRQASLVTITK